jgi:hypothetical protein
MEKEKLIETMKSEMQNWHTKLDELKVQANLGKKELGDAVQPAIDNIELELDKFGKRMKEFQEASGDALEHVKTGANTALDAIKKSFKEASSHFKK